MTAPLRIPGAPPFDHYGLPGAQDVCGVCGLFLELAPGSDRCLRCEEQARESARRAARRHRR